MIKGLSNYLVNLDDTSPSQTIFLFKQVRSVDILSQAKFFIDVNKMNRTEQYQYKHFIHDMLSVYLSEQYVTKDMLWPFCHKFTISISGTIVYFDATNEKWAS